MLDVFNIIAEGFHLVTREILNASSIDLKKILKHVTKVASLFKHHSLTRFKGWHFISTLEMLKKGIGTLRAESKMG